MGSRGSGPGPCTVQEMANFFPEKRGRTPAISVGEKWLHRFVKQRPLFLPVLETVYLRAR
jgi:hypothetical protein